MMQQRLKGNYPVLATAWSDDGQFDATTQARLIDWLIDSGVHGLVMLAKASEGHAQSDSTRRRKPFVRLPTISISARRARDAS